MTALAPQRRAQRRSNVVGLLLALSLVGGACTSSSTPSDSAGPAETIRPGGTVVFAADAEPTAGFNNRTTKGNTTALRNVMRRVWPSAWITTPDFRTVLDTSVVVSADVMAGVSPQTIVYRINPDAKWSDGVPISAEDFIYNVEVEKPGATDVDGKPISWVAPGEETIQSVTGSPDGKTVTVVLAQPFAEWRSIFAKPLVPAHIAKRVGWNSGFDNFDPTVVISGGPFRIESYNKGQNLTLVRNESWRPQPNLDSVIFRFDVPSPALALANNEVQAVAPRAQVDVVGQLRGTDGVVTVVGTGFDAEFLDINLRNEFLAVPEVRRAFALALDRQAILERTARQIDPAAKVMQNRLLSLGDPGYADRSGGRYDKPDVAGAKRLLESVGFVAGPDGVYAKDGKRLSFRITSTTGDALRENQGELIQTQVRQAGIDLRLDAVAPSALTRRLLDGDFDVVSLLQGIAVAPTTTNLSFGTGGSVNISKYSSPAVDALYARAKTELNDVERAKLLNQIDEQLWNDLPRIPLYQRPTVVAYRNTLVNVGVNAVSGPLWNIEQWGMKGPAKR
jgi:peptide/nickel transport system substrate-binding protein